MTTPDDISADLAAFLLDLDAPARRAVALLAGPAFERLVDVLEDPEVPAACALLVGVACWRAGLPCPQPAPAPPPPPPPRLINVFVPPPPAVNRFVMPPPMVNRFVMPPPAVNLSKTKNPDQGG